MTTTNSGPSPAGPSGSPSRRNPSGPAVGPAAAETAEAGQDATAAGPRPGMAVLARTWLWGWLAIAQFGGGLLLGGFYLALGSILVVGVLTIPAIGVGIPITAGCLLAAMVLGAFERVRVEAFTGVHIRRPTPPQRSGRPPWRRALLDARPWRASSYLVMIAIWDLIVGTVTLMLISVSVALAALPLYASHLPRRHLALPFGPGVDVAWWLVVIGWAGVAVVPLVARGLVTVDVSLARWLLGPSSGEQVVALCQRVETLTLTREATVDSVELERRRIERDLHDGPQQRLVAIAMDLGMARAKLAKDPAGAHELLDRAHASAKEAITEMRQVARGIHPPVLTDRGLDAALSALAARTAIPVTVRVDVTTRPQPTVEAIAYFCVSEALTNVAKHSRATSARVDVVRADGKVVITVTDDGVGGADPARGSGLVGLRDRVAAVDGTITVSSPPGGPTVLTVRLPESRNPYRAPGPAPVSPILVHPVHPAPPRAHPTPPRPTTSALPVPAPADKTDHRSPQ